MIPMPAERQKKKYVKYPLNTTTSYKIKLTFGKKFRHLSYICIAKSVLAHEISVLNNIFSRNCRDSSRHKSAIC